MNILRPDEKSSILDVGFNDTEYFENDNFLEKNYPWRKNITALGLDEPVNFNKIYPEIKALAYDGKVFPFRDKEFDIIWSNAVLEHVGNFDRQAFFLKEINRVARKAFITTPNKFFPFEVHTKVLFLHFISQRVFHWYLRLIGKNWATGEYMFLLSKRDIEKLFASAGIEKYKIIRNRLVGFTLDFNILFGEYDQ